MQLRNNSKLVLLLLLLLCLVGGLVSCDAREDSISAGEDAQQPEQPTHYSEEDTSVADNSSVEDNSSAKDPSDELEQEASMPDPSDPAVIQQDWENCPHAATFVLDADGQNNSCARCHAPINWQPSMDDLPETCFACKFELEDPPSYISEDEWGDIPCQVCHKVDKDGNVEPEYIWLEIPALEEYASVETPTELCMKCHNPINIAKHGNIPVGGAHEGYECTQCHNAHETVASCGTVDCHEDVTEPGTAILGHDDDHQAISCVACHDGAGLEVGPSEESGYWITYVPWSYETTINETDTNTETGVVALTSHNIVLEANCERCHFAGNPWGLSELVESP